MSGTPDTAAGDEQLQGDDTEFASVDSSLPACDPQASVGQNNTKYPELVQSKVFTEAERETARGALPQPSPPS